MDFFNEHPEIHNQLPSEEAKEFNTIASFYLNNYGTHRFPKISEATRTAFDAALKNEDEEVKSKLPEFSLDLRLTHLNHSILFVAGFQKYPTYYKIAFLAPSLVITGTLATGVMGTGILRGIALTGAIIWTGGRYIDFSIAEKCFQTCILAIKNPINRDLDSYRRFFGDSEIMDEALSKIKENLEDLKSRNVDATNLEKSIRELEHARDYYSNPEMTHSLA
ncbi:MAG: hypothetical protein H0W50_09215 [Parachlamydiaceae bacterium]|nr:hypothetical protein [Parachlamydiaceae bacterium]